MKLFAQGFEEEPQTEHHKQCANTESYCVNTPSRKRSGFRYSDINDKRIVAQRAHSNQTSFAIEIAWRAILPTTLRNKSMPRRPCGHFVTSAICRVGVARDNS